MITVGENLSSRRKQASFWKAEFINHPYASPETKESSSFQYDTENKLYYDERSIFKKSKVIGSLFTDF